MRKITLIAALLGSAYFANAQVGIGTSTPAEGTMLHIKANDKGIIIPNVELQSITDVKTVVGTELESLLVYNTATGNGVTPGFYYWVAEKGSVDAHWERVVNQTQLNEVIESQADIAKIKELLDAAYGSNNLGDTVMNNPFGGMVFTPADGSTAAKFEYVKWNTTSTSYERLDITSVITDLINASETKTKIVTIEDVQYYVSESYTGTTEPTVGNEPGVYKIDVVGGVVNNFSEIINSNTTIGTTNQTIKQYFEELGATDSNTVYFNNTNTSLTLGNVSVPAYTFYLKDASGNAIVINLADLIANLEAVTTLVKSNGTLADPITYTYSNEDVINGVQGATPTVIEITADMVTSITNNTDVQNAISNVLNQGGNVYYGDVNGENVFYTIVNGVKTPVEISQVVVNAITSATTIQKQEIKNELGDKFYDNRTNTVVNLIKTGDTWIDGGDIYKEIFNTKVLKGTANIIGGTEEVAGSITMTAPEGTELGNVISIKILDVGTNSLITESVTDVKIESGKLYFRIGTGTMYNILSNTTDLEVNVLVEYSAKTIIAL